MIYTQQIHTHLKHKFYNIKKNTLNILPIETWALTSRASFRRRCATNARKNRNPIQCSPINCASHRCDRRLSAAPIIRIRTTTWCRGMITQHRNRPPRTMPTCSLCVKWKDYCKTIYIVNIHTIKICYSFFQYLYEHKQRYIDLVYIIYFILMPRVHYSILVWSSGYSK